MPRVKNEIKIENALMWKQSAVDWLGRSIKGGLPSKPQGDQSWQRSYSHLKIEADRLRLNANQHSPNS